jgi:hypothetical protein
MATLEELRHHVQQDAYDLARAIGMVEPLVSSPTTLGNVAMFLQHALALDVLLLVTRLHAKPVTGPIGETASIDSVLDAAAAERVLTSAEAARFRKRRETIMAELEARDLPYAAMRQFRNAEIAHSLHRRSTKEDEKLFYHPIQRCALETHRLVLAIDAALIAGGARPSSNPHLATALEKWGDRGSRFWAMPMLKEFV